ncbi:MAG: hypothetical protein EU532_03985 [Promethearchaeota archaeon]|nr:MAG: hypothetical protein EU532_03985 [Candidatus Lokiarchaeota archaeon]
MSLNPSSNLDEIYNTLVNGAKEKIGIICLNHLVNYCTIEDLKQVIKEYDIPLSQKNDMTQLDYFKYICRYFYNYYFSNSQNQALYSDVLSYIGTMLLKNENFQNVLKMHDFITKKEMINAFCDWCADLGISAFDTSEIPEFSLDLYFTKKTPRLRTEAVFIRIGDEMNKNNYEYTLKLIQQSSKIAAWTVFVATPYGVHKIGLFKLIGDMERLNTWLYIVDPLEKRILGIVKGKKSKVYDEKKRDNYIKNLPREPIRAPSQVVKFSKYDLNYAESYKTSKFALFELLNEQEHNNLTNIPPSEPKYQNIFRNLIISDKEAGLPLFTLSAQTDQADQVLISGFMTAIDDFVSRIGGTSSMKEINYKGFIIQAAYGKNVKLALFLSEQADDILKERLAYFLKFFEQKYDKQIESFRKRGDTAIFDDEEIIPIVKYILDI